MKILLQRVKEAGVFLKQEKIIKAKIEKGILLFVGFCKNDVNKNDDDFTKTARKILKLRIFEDDQGKMNHDVISRQGNVLIVSQFTLCGDPYQGNRPSFTGAMEPEMAKDFYEKFINIMKREYRNLYQERYNHTLQEATLDFLVQSGKFQSYMEIPLINDGPVSFYMEF